MDYKRIVNWHNVNMTIYNYAKENPDYRIMPKHIIKKIHESICIEYDVRENMLVEFNKCHYDFIGVFDYYQTKQLKCSIPYELMN